MKVFLIDGHSLLFRAHYAFFRRPLVTAKGQVTSAMFGFLSMFSSILKTYTPDKVVFSFDLSRKTFRNDLYEDYKANRGKTPEEIKEQTPLIMELLETMGYPVVTCEGYEADDVIGTLSRLFSSKGEEVTIVTGDRDSLQLVTDKVKVLLTRKGISETVEFTPETVMENYGVSPEQLIDVKALQGDSSDNIPGVPGIGEKGALKLISEYSTLENIYENIDSFKGKKKQNLEENKDLAFLCRQLGTIDTAVEPLTNVDTIVEPEADSSKISRMLAEYELTRFKSCTRGGFDEISPFTTDESGQGLLFGGTSEAIPEEKSTKPDRTVKYTPVISEKRFNELVKKLKAAELIGIDTETTSENPITAKLAGISFCFWEGEAWYLPLIHGSSPTQLERKDDYSTPEKIIKRLKPLLERKTLACTGHNLKFDYKVLKAHSITLSNIAFDSMLAAYLLDPSSRRYSLKAVSERYLHHPMIEFKDLIGTRAHFGEIPIDEATPYACDDAETALRLYNVLRKELDSAQLTQLFNELEIQLVPILAEMEMAGIKINKPFLQALSKDFALSMELIEQKAWGIAGREFNLKSPKQLGEILFDEKGFRPVKKTKGGTPSTDSFVLETLAAEQNCELAREILLHRHYAKLKGTYVDPMPEMTDEDGKIHTVFNQTRTETGRLSSVDPNLQNIPVRSEDGQKIREAFIPATNDTVFVAADYSQIELRILAHYSKSPVLKKAFQEGQDIHRETAARVFHVSPEEVTPEQRSRAKAVNFGILYGQTGFGLARELKIPQAEAKKMIDQYFAVMPSIKTWKDETIEQAVKNLSVTTICGRHRQLPDLQNKPNNPRRKAAEREAVNTIIQGSAADLIKKAMILLHKKLKESNLKATILLQVHDELILECPRTEREQVSALLKEVMESAMELNVPLDVSLASGDNWAQLK